ncbi:MAG: hypothetical protein GY792_24160 [Gammaproteobacteria bacterium]|nr:hypothetical protein [Gammaproteobacteria bacterium]
MGTDWKALADNAKSRSETYGLLANIFREEPSEALINELRGPRLSGVFSALDVELGDNFYNDPTSEVKESLSLEFTRLFIGPGPHISAHESIFSDMDSGMGALWGPKTVEVKKFIETTGLDYELRFTGIPDHVSVEFEFMQKLTEWEAEKWIQEDRKSAEYCLTVQRMFLEKHLLCWILQFCNAVMDKTETPFYRAIADLTKNYMEFERQDILTDSAA